MSIQQTKTSVALVVAGLSMVVLSGCAAQMGAGGSNQALARENRDMRSMLKQAMRELRQVEAEQERLRATVETLEYRQRVLAERAGVDPGAVVSGPSAPAAFRSARSEAPQFGSAAPDNGLDILSNGNSGAPAGPPRRFGSPPAAMAGPQPSEAMASGPQPDPRRARGRVIGPEPVDQASRPSDFGPSGPPESPERSARVRANRQTPPTRPSAPMQIRAEDEPRLPVVPPALKSGPYGDAAKQVRDGEYEAAVQNYRDFIYSNPQSPYADDAQYWIGESYLRKGAYSKAIIEFNQVVVNYRSGDRSARALLKQAEVFSLLGDEVDARLSLQKVVNNYPGTPEAARAAGLLDGDGGEISAVR